MTPETKTQVAEALRAAAAKLSGADADEGDEGEGENRFEERLGEVMDVENAANALLEVLAPLNEIDDAPATLMQGIIDALSTAGTVEKESDLDLNLKDALDLSEQLKLALVVAKKSVKDADEDSFGAEEKAAAKEVIRDAVSDLRSLVKDIQAI